MIVVFLSIKKTCNRLELVTENPCLLADGFSYSTAIFEFKACDFVIGMGLVIGHGSFCHPLDQSDANLKPTASVATSSFPISRVPRSRTKINSSEANLRKLLYQNVPMYFVG